MRFFPSYILAMALSATVARAADGTTFSLRASPADFVIEPVDVGVAIRYSGAAGAVPRGAPDLPVLVKLLPGVHGKQARALIEAAEFEEVSGIEVAPAGSEDASIYSKDAYWPAEPVEIQEAYQGTKKYVRVAIHPAQYNPVRGILRIYSVLDVRVVHAPGVDPGSASLALQEPAGPPPVAFAEGLDVCDACPDALDSLLPPMNGAAGDFAARRAGAEVEAAWRIGVTNKGVYRVTRAAMTNSGIAAADIMGDSLRLYCRSQEVAITTSTAGLFGPDDYFLFYGLGNDGYYSDTNVYWLGFEPGGKRMATRDAAPIGGAANVTSHCARIRIDPYESYRSAYQPQRDNEHWFAANLTGGASRDYAFATLDPVVGEAAELFFHFHGLDGTGNATTSGIPKNTRIAVSLTTVTNVTYPGESETNGTVTFSSSLLVDGSTTVRLTQTLAGPTRQMYLDELTLRYPRDLAAVSDRLCFPGEAGTNNYVIQEFSTNNNLVVLDVTDHGNPVSLTNFTVASSAGGYALTFGDQPSQAACYLALHTNEVKNIASLDPIRFRNLTRTDREADYIVICPYEFRAEVYELLKYRKLEGLKVVVAPLSDVYNEFSYGVADAAAIKQFLGYAFHHWSGSPPGYAVLAGKGSVDPKNYRGFGVPEIIPVRPGPTDFRWTAQDLWYGMVNGSDFLADIAMARIPATNGADIAAVYDKTVIFEAAPTNAPWRSEALVVADNFEVPLDFKQDTLDHIVPHLTNGAFTVSDAYLFAPDTVPGVRGEIGSFINNDGLLVNYLGHGDEEFWTAENVWNLGDIASLSNTNYPIVSIFSCNNGYFHDPELATVSLAETFILTPSKGAVACFAPSLLSRNARAVDIADGFYQSLAVDKDKRLGDAMLDGLLNAWTIFAASDELFCYEIFGDPALVVNPD